jgi:uncharacterized membrane protein YcfT
MKMNEPPNDRRPMPPMRSPWSRLTRGAQVIGVLIYVAVVTVLLAVIIGAGAFIAYLIRGAL